VFKNRIKRGVKEIRVIYEKEDGTEEVYIASPRTWVKMGTADKLGDFPKQIFLSKSDFDKVIR